MSRSRSRSRYDSESERGGGWKKTNKGPSIHYMVNQAMKEMVQEEAIFKRGIKTEDPKQLKRKRQQRWPRSVECVIGTSKTNPMLDPYYW